MSIKEGYKAVSKALFGIGPSESIDCGICTRCKASLKFNPANGNCQPNCRFKFHPMDPITGVFNGAWVKFEWEASLCDFCLGSLSDWLLGKGWRKREMKERNK